MWITLRAERFLNSAQKPHLYGVQFNKHSMDALRQNVDGIMTRVREVAAIDRITCEHKPAARKKYLKTLSRHIRKTTVSCHRNAAPISLIVTSRTWRL